jgi:hypothetical protein
LEAQQEPLLAGPQLGRPAVRLPAVSSALLPVPCWVHSSSHGGPATTGMMDAAGCVIAMGATIEYRADTATKVCSNVSLAPSERKPALKSGHVAA